MKKVFPSILLTLLAAVFISSCSSIPKTVKPGDTLVIGRVEAYVHGYKQYEDVKFDGRILGNMEITVRNVKTRKSFVVKTDKDGCFIINNCKPHEQYALEGYKLQIISNSGYSRTVWVTLSYPPTFIAYDNQVINVGGIYLDFDGEKNVAFYEVKNHYYVKQFFEDFAAESEWADKPIVDWRNK
ncbi:MAG: hypothetical protein K6A43_09230 [Treponema sp.]|nr:hypothetical protein [Treponema sp.]